MLTEIPLGSVRDRVLLLRSLGSFSGLDDEGMTLVAEHARGRSFRAGETLLTEGRPLSHVYIVIDGQLTSERLGQRVAVVTRSRGVGFLSMMARDEQGVTVVADVDTQTLEVPTEVLEHGLEENFSLVRNTLRNIAAALVKKRGNLPAPADKPPPFSLGEFREREHTLVERILDLRSGRGIFQDCNLDAVFAFARRIEEIRVEPGTVFWKIGEPSSFWLRLDHGRVRCRAADGATVDVGHRYVLGIMDAVGQVERSYEARAETLVIAYRNQLETLLDVLEMHFDLARDFIAVLARALLETPDRA